MSFSGTPLGQGRRLDHNTFLGKPPSTGNRPPSPLHQIPTSYAYGAPTLGSRSPPKSSAPIRERSSNHTFDQTEDDDDASALTKYARIKQREQSSLSSRPGGPKTITSPPNPVRDKWASKDTSVNVATAFTLAAATTMMPSNPNDSWASGSSRPNVSIPRSTSVEYEAQAQSTSQRRLAPPPNRLTAARVSNTRKPLGKSGSSGHVPDSEGEGGRQIDRNVRGKSPFEGLVNAASRILEPVSYYMHQRAQENDSIAEEPSAAQASANGKDSSYDYSAEERDYRSIKRADHAIHKRGRMSTDNKAYKPTQSDQESDEDFVDDDKGKRRRKKKKKEPTGGPLNTLPVLSHDKRKRRKGKGSKGDLQAEDDDSESSDHATEQHSAQTRASVSRLSAPPPSVRASVPRNSVPPDYPANDPNDTSADLEQRLKTIPEEDAEKQASALEKGELKSRATTPRASSRPWSIGGFLGNAVHYLLKGGKNASLRILQFLMMIMFVVGRIIGTIFDVIFRRPSQWIGHANSGPAMLIGKYIALGGIALFAWYMLQDPVAHWIPRLPNFKLGGDTTYRAPEVPAANIAELSARLQRIENALSGLSLDSERTKARADSDAKSHSDLIGRLGTLESRVQAESRRAAEAEAQFKKTASQGLSSVKQEVEIMQAQILSHQQQQERADRRRAENSGSGSDEEARVRLKLLEERVGTVEGGVKEALELGKKAGSGVATTPGAAWWHKLASGVGSKSALVIKTPDGQDVTEVIKVLVDSSVSMYSKDTLAKPDFALNSGGARVIPSLTSPTFEMRPPNLRSQLVGIVTGNGFRQGRPPITALHHEQVMGHCWPLAGTEGQLGVALAAPVYISEISIDHVAKETAFDMRSAPKQMEVWGMVEGKDNIAKVKEWQAEKQRQREEALERGEVASEEEDVAYPKTLPKSPEYIRIANFSYDIHAPRNVQTFPVLQEIQDLGVDFGIVVLRIQSNWGMDAFTCLYRMRVHGQRMGEIPLPHSEELD